MCLESFYHRHIIINQHFNTKALVIESEVVVNGVAATVWSTLTVFKWSSCLFTDTYLNTILSCITFYSLPVKDNIESISKDCYVSFMDEREREIKFLEESRIQLRIEPKSSRLLVKHSYSIASLPLVLYLWDGTISLHNHFYQTCWNFVIWLTNLNLPFYSHAPIDLLGELV